MRRFINYITGRLYWYQIKICYAPKDGPILFYITVMVGHTRKRYILDKRLTLKVSGFNNRKDIKLTIKNLPKQDQDGEATIIVLAYVGYIKRQK